MTMNDLYVKMGKYGLYDLRDEFFEWSKEYSWRREIDDEMLEKIPDKYITALHKEIQKTRKKILKAMGGEK